MVHTLYVGTDPILAYQRYRLRVKAQNLFGDSDYSEELPVAIAPLPSQPDPITKDQTLSTKTSIKVDWTAPSDTLAPIGYKLYMKDDNSQITTLVYDGSTNANLRSFIAQDL